MTFPTATWAETNQSSLATTVSVALPAGIVAGDLLLCLGRSNNTLTGYGFPTGWVELKDAQYTATSGDRVCLAYKFVVAGSAEIGASTMSVTQGSAKAAFSTARIQLAHASSPPEVSADATGSSTTPNPLTLSPSWGADDTLWLWLGSWEGEQTSPPASAPATGYGTTGGANSGTAGNPDTNSRTAHAQKNANAATDDPGAWTISVTDEWVAWTVAIRPAAVLAPTATTVARISLASGDTPDTRTAHSIKARVRKASGTGTVLFKAALYEGGTNRSGDLTTGAITTSFADYSLAISDANAANVTSYADLEIRFWATCAQGDTINVDVANIYLEAPEGTPAPAGVAEMAMVV